jgi:3-oxo-5alpha-steroid 4-dehydrogenase
MSSSVKHPQGITRRDFLKGAATGAAAAMGASILASCGPAPATGLPEKWDREADVVVVGFGGAGAAASIEVARAGAQVLALERMPVGGGSTALCGGIIYMGGGTPVQKAAGFEDTLENMYNYLIASAGAGADPDMVQTYVDNNLELFDWLVDIGVQFKESFIPGKWAAVPTDDGLAYSGNETRAEYQAVAEPVPRGHHVQAPGNSGNVLWPPLQSAAEEAGVETLYEALVEQVVVNPEGRVVGVVANIDGEEQAIKANQGVVLTAGGFGANKDMVSRHCPEFIVSEVLTGTEGDDGSGIRMGQGAGADVRQLGQAFAYSAVYMYSEALVKGMLVNMQGRRFVGEDHYGSFIGERLIRNNQYAFLIIDDVIWSEVPEAAKEAIPMGGQADTLAELATALGIPANMLENSVQLYNEFAANGEDLEFHKEGHYLVPLETSPFYAIPYLAQYAAFFTTGGLRINTRSQVLDETGAPVEGLYAAGRNAFAVTACNYPGSGTSVGEALIFGRIAGQEVAALEAWA